MDNCDTTPRSDSAVGDVATPAGARGRTIGAIIAAACAAAFAVGVRRRRGSPRVRSSGKVSASSSGSSEVPIKVTLEEAFHGTTRTLESADGTRLQANIPRGVRTGSKVRMKSTGNQGNIILKVEVTPNPQFERDEDNLRVELPVDLYSALLGGEVQVPTLERPVVLTIPSGTQNGRTFRLRGLGMPQLKQPDQRGDLLAVVAVKLPTNLSDEEKALIEQLRTLRSAATGS